MASRTSSSRAALIALIFGFSCVFTACSGASKKPYRVTSMIASTLAIRRPPGAPADPKSGPGGADYKSEPLPNAKLDCESGGTWLESLPLEKIRICLASIPSGVEATYRLIRDAQPWLELQDPDDAPPCLREELSSIPVPREIFFQHRSAGRIEEPARERGLSPIQTNLARDTANGAALGCFNLRLPIEADRTMGFRLPVKKWALRIAFPLDAGVLGEAAISRLLTAWALTPLWVTDEGGEVPVNWVPDSLCKRCLGPDRFIEKAPVDPEWNPAWPR